jgi:hypothetical protein
MAEERREKSKELFESHHILILSQSYSRSIGKERERLGDTRYWTVEGPAMSDGSTEQGAEEVTSFNLKALKTMILIYSPCCTTSMSIEPDWYNLACPESRS